MLDDHEDDGGKMERRKIQLSGRTTFVVSLPKTWVQAANLEAGDTVGIDAQDDGSLRIVPDTVRRRRAPGLDMDASGVEGERLLRELMAGYLSGYDLVSMKSTSAFTADQRGAVKRMTQMTVGFEIVEETTRTVVLQDMVDPTQFASRGGLQRLARIVHLMLTDVLVAVENRDLELADDVIGRDDSVDRMYLMIGKQHVHLLSDISMARRKQVTLKESLFMSQAARSLERCGDHAVRIAYAIKEAMDENVEFDPAAWGSVRKLADEALVLLQDSVQAFMKADRDTAHRVLDASERLTRQRGELTRQLLAGSESETLVLSLVVESLERVHQYAADICEAALAHATVVDAARASERKGRR